MSKVITKTVWSNLTNLPTVLRCESCKHFKSIKNSVVSKFIFLYFQDFFEKCFWQIKFLLSLTHIDFRFLITFINTTILLASLCKGY